MIGETFLLPGYCGSCGEPVVLVPPFEGFESPDGRVHVRGQIGWRWVDPWTGTVHSCR